MAIELNDVTSGYSTGVINNNFQTVEEEINNNVLRRAGISPGEANHMEVPLDMNSNLILNVLTDVENPGSLITVGEGDFRYVNTSGDSMEGPLYMGGNPITVRAPVAGNEPSQKSQLDKESFERKAEDNNLRQAISKLEAVKEGDLTAVQDVIVETETGAETLRDTLDNRQTKTRITLAEFGYLPGLGGDASSAIQDMLADGRPVDWGSYEYRFSTPIFHTATAPIDWIAGGARLVYTGEPEAYSAFSIVCGLGTDNIIKGVFDVSAGAKAHRALRIESSAITNTLEEEWPSIRMQYVTGRDVRADTDSDGNVAGIQIVGGFSVFEAYSCWAKDVVFGPSVDTSALDRATVGISTFPLAGLMPRVISLTNPIVSRVWNEGKTGAQQEADALSLFQATGTESNPTTSTCTIDGLVSNHVGNRSIKLHSAVRAIVTGTTINKSSAVMPFSGLTRTADIDCQQGGAIVLGVDCYYDGVLPPRVVHNYTEQSGRVRSAGITKDVKLAFSAATDSLLMDEVVYHRNDNLAVGVDVKPVISIEGVYSNKQIKKVARLSIRGTGTHSYSMSNITANCSEGFFIIQDNNSSNAVVTATASNCINTNSIAVPLFFGASSPNWGLSSVGCFFFSDRDSIDVAAGGGLTLRGTQGYMSLDRAVEIGGGKVNVSSGSNVTTSFDIDASEISSAGFTTRIGRSTNTSGDVRLNLYRGDGSAMEAVSLSSKDGLYVNDGVLRIPEYTVAGLPAPLRRSVAMVNIGNGILVFADGTNWRRIDTNAIVA